MDTRTPGAPRSRTWIVAASGLAVLLLSGCGGDGGITVPSRTRTLPSVSVSVPSVAPSSEAPETATPTEEASQEPTQEPTETETATPTPRPTPSPRPTKSVIVTQTVTPTPPVTETATATVTPTPTETPTPTPTPTAAAAPAATDADDGGLPAWLWWLLAILLAGLVAYLILRARRRAAWDAEEAEAEVEVGWLARELLPQLQQSGTPEALAGGWQVSAARAGAAEDRFTGLETSAPDETRAARARDLRDAVRAARSDVESLITSRDQLSTPVVLAASIARLQDLLNPPQPTQ